MTDRPSRALDAQWPDVGRGRRVLIVGGGLAGLCAARALRQAGFQPVVFERADQIGGRFSSERAAFPGYYVELGATRIPETHALVLAYARHCRLTLHEFLPSPQIWWVDGARFVNTPGARPDYPPSLDLHVAERDLDAEMLVKSLAMRLCGGCGGDPGQPGWTGDHETYLHRLAASGASPGALRLCRAYDGSEIESAGALAWLTQQRLHGNWNRSLAIAGGNDLLTTRLADELECVVRGAEVHAVRTTRRGVSLGCRVHGVETWHDGDFAICAVPHRALLDVVFDPPLSAEKREACGDLPMFPVTRLNFAFSRRFWRDEGVSGLLVACTTTAIERLWDLTVNQPGDIGVLAAYVQGDNARTLDELADDETRLAYGLGIVDMIFPGARRWYLRGSVYAWHHRVGVYGAWPMLRPGQVGLLPALRRREGRVLFAGDHTSLLSGWAEGALESAHRVVDELIALATTP